MLFFFFVGPLGLLWPEYILALRGRDAAVFFVPQLPQLPDLFQLQIQTACSSHRYPQPVTFSVHYWAHLLVLSIPENSKQQFPEKDLQSPGVQEEPGRKALAGSCRWPA